MKRYLSILIVALISVCFGNAMELHKKNDISIEKIENTELENAFVVFSQLNPKMSKSEFLKNYHQLKEYFLYKATITKNDQKQIVGLIGWLFNEDLCVGRAMYVDVLVIDKQYRNQGIAEKLMNFAISKLHQDEKAKCIRWTTRNDLTEAINFYRTKIKEPIGYYYRIDNPNYKD